MIWEIEIDLISVWYWFLIGLILAVCLYATWKHNTFIPIMWGAFMSSILYMGATILEPLIFGYQYYDMYSIQWFLVSAFGLMFMLINVQYLYNIVKYGTVIE